MTMTTHAWQTNQLAWRRRCSAYTKRAHATPPSRKVNPTCRQTRAARRARLWLRTAMRLDPADIEQIARQVVDLIAVTQARPSGQFVDAAELAALLGVERVGVRVNPIALGAIRLGGPRGRLRFDLQRVQDGWSATTTHGARPGTGRSHKKRSRANRPGLIPYESPRPTVTSSRERRV